MKLILASTSPRRYELLSRLGISFDTMAAEIDESVRIGESPTDYIIRMVESKARYSINVLKSTNRLLTKEGALVLTADTIGILANGKDVLVKPIDRKNAFEMWQQMSGNIHNVWTAVQANLISPDGTVLWSKRIIESTTVKFISLNEREMSDYWNTGEPCDKAGGYAIQGLAAAWVEYIEGSYTNVVGLPLAQTKLLIEYAKGVSEQC